MLQDERISELEAKTIKIIQSEQQKESTMLKEYEDCSNKCFNVHIFVRVPEVEERQRVAEKYSKK